MAANVQAFDKNRPDDTSNEAIDLDQAGLDLARLQANADAACELLKSMAHEGRLIILGLLSLKERSVMELEQTLDLRQPAVSQQLARLRSDNLVATRRDGKMIYYSIISEEARAIIRTLAGFYDTQPAVTTKGICDGRGPQ